MRDAFFLGWIIRHWRGEIPLVRSWWLVGALGGGSFLLTFLVLLMGLTEPPDMETARLFLGWLGLVALYFLWAMVGIWRAARRYEGPRHWRHGARASVLAGVALASLLVVAILFPPGR